MADLPIFLGALDRWRREQPDSVMVVDYSQRAYKEDGGLEPRRRTTWGEAWEEIVALSAALRRHGIRPGDIVGVQLPTWHEYLLAHLAIMAVGGVTMLISPIYRTRDVEKQLRMANASALFVAASYRTFDHVEMATELLRDVASLRLVFVAGECSGHKGVVDWNALLAAGRSRDCGELREAVARGDFAVPADSMMLLNFSSGTTGEPKGVTHSAASISAAILPMAARVGLTRREVILVAVTLGHAAGFLNGMYLPLLLGATVVYVDNWDPEMVLKVAEREQVTYAPMMPTHLFDIANHPTFETVDIARWRCARVSGGPIARGVVASLQSRMPNLRICPGWGFSEVLYATCCSPDDPIGKRVETDGRPLDGYRIEVRDPESGRTCRPGESGEVVVQSPSLMLGYYDREDLTWASYTLDGWFKSGDLGLFDSDGYLTIIGRSKDLIIRGGENVPAIEIEQLLLQHAKVRAVAIVGVPDARLGEKVCAVVEGADVAEAITFAEMREFLFSRKLTRQFVPEYLVVLSTLPRTDVGKIKKQEVRLRVITKLNLA